MKQALVYGIVAFVFAIGGSTWFSAFLAPPPAPPPVRAAADTGPTATGTKPPAAAVPTSTRIEPASPAATDRATRPDSTAKPVAHAPTAVPDSLRVTPATAKSVGKILANMKPVQAAKILAGLRNDEVEAVLRQLNPKQVASLLAALPNERATVLSRQLLVPAGLAQGTRP